MKHPAERPRATALLGGHVIAFVAATMAFACTSTFDGLELAPVPDPCTHALPPLAPALATHDPTSLEFVAVVNAYDMGEIDHSAKTERFRAMGYDLDQTCTGQGQGPSCDNEAWKTLVPVIDGDALDGRDNTQGAVVYRLFNSEIGHSTTREVNDTIQTGELTTLIRVLGYNGTDVDGDVEVQIFAATMRRPDGTQAVPLWQGNDEWGPVHEWVGKNERQEWSAEHPKFFDADAYVTSSFLVARFKRFQTPKVMMSHMVITARIVQRESGFSLTEGTMAARANSDDLLVGLAGFRDPETGQWICRDGKNYRRHKQNVCSASDIGIEPSADPLVRCDATSWGWHFTALPAKLSSPAPFTFIDPLVDHCLPGEFPGDDSCANF